MKTATRQRNGRSAGVLRLSWHDGKTLPWATVLLDADGGDQAALTLPVGRVVFLFEPIMDSFSAKYALLC